MLSRFHCFEKLVEPGRVTLAYNEMNPLLLIVLHSALCTYSRFGLNLR